MQRQGKLLLVLDNAEYVVREAAPVIEAWLAECPKLQILATSLEPLGLPGETRMTLGPLSPEDAVALYLDRARRAGGRLSMDRIAIEALVEKLDRIPLAIELAAARAHVLPPSQFLSRIGQRFQLLQGGRPGRHGSLEQAIACSWELLREDEKVAVAQISVFMGGFTLDAAEAVLDCGPHAPPVLEILASLVSMGLLAHDGGAPPRFAPYESLREYAHERLIEMGQVEATIRRHAKHYLQLGEAQAERYESCVEAHRSGSTRSGTTCSRPTGAPWRRRRTSPRVSAWRSGAATRARAPSRRSCSCSTRPSPRHGARGCPGCWRALWSPARGLRRTDVLMQAMRLARRFVGEGEDGAPYQLAVGPDGAFFRVGRRETISLRSRKPLRRILVALVERRLEHPGRGMGVEELARKAWPGEVILPRAAANRVYNAVRALRKMGLDDALQRQEDGYLLSPSLDVVWAPEA